MRLLLLVGLVFLGGCEPGDVGERASLVQGDAARGKHLVAELGCGACHRIPGVVAARGRVGPDLAGFARQGYIAGQRPNRTPELLAWIRNAPAVDPATAMPAYAMSASDARDIATFLYRLN